MREDKKPMNFPLVFSRGQTPEVNACTPNKNIFNFEGLKSPNLFNNAISPFKKYPGGDYILDDTSPFRADYLLNKNVSSPAFNYNDSSYRRNQGHNYFFDPFPNNPGSVNKTPENVNMYFAVNNPGSSSKMNNIFFNFDQKFINTPGKSAFNVPRNFGAKKEE
mmetsp:Transcript_10320/g.11554  ORF Transcript_10320/g.11554 Transcript_10320/m.11554 type:complete len:163 (-) Transcript_10320:33-521(-)